MSRSSNKLRLAVLVSGGGTNLQALLDRAAQGTLSAEIVCVASDRPDAFGLVRAERAGVPGHVVDYRSVMSRDLGRDFARSLPVDLDELDRVQRILKNPDRERRLLRLARLVLAEQALIRILDDYQPDYVCLAGFMRLVSPYFIGHFNQGKGWRVLNIHPALLPAFPGEHGYDDTFAYGCKWGGITVHFVDEGEDSGPVLAQAVYPLWPEDDGEAVRRRGLELEYELYAQCINWIAAHQVETIRSPAGRVTTAITDPAYREILRGWTQKALA